jgi:uncharacterized protein (UPF0335 family)
MASESDNEIKSLIVEVYEEIEQFSDERTELNAKIQAGRARLKARGIHPKAFDLVRRFMQLDESKRAGFDLAYMTIREALGVPVDPQGTFDDYIETTEEDGEENDE